MPTSPEQSSEARLASFRDQIKKIVELRKNKDATAQNIVNVNELTSDDKVIWDFYLLHLRQTLEPEANFMTILSKVDLVAKLVRSKEKETENVSKRAFLEWMINRLTIIIGSLQTITIDGHYKEEILNDLQAEFDAFSK